MTYKFIEVPTGEKGEHPLLVRADQIVAIERAVDTDTGNDQDATLVWLLNEPHRARYIAIPYAEFVIYFKGLMADDDVWWAKIQRKPVDGAGELSDPAAADA